MLQFSFFLLIILPPLSLPPLPPHSLPPQNKNSHTGPPQPDVHMLPPVLNPQPTTFHPPPHLPPFHGNGPAMPPPADYYNGYQQQGFPPSPGPDWNGPGPGFYGEFGGGGGAPPIRRGMRGNFRGRGRGFFPTEFSKGTHILTYAVTSILIKQRGICLRVCLEWLPAMGIQG